nr:hypothetical protein [Tanacetum cinerariifolium]
MFRVILEKIIIDLEDEVVSLLDKEKENLKIIESLKSKAIEIGVDSSEKVVSVKENKSENDCQVIEKVYASEENPNVIAPGIFRLSVSQSVSPISVTKTFCASNSVESKLKRKRRKRTSSKQHDTQVNKDVLHANKDFVHFLDLDTLSSVRKPKPSGVMWMMKGSSNTVKADFSSVNHSNLNKNVNRYSRKNLMACNNFETRSAFDCNNARNALCNARMNAFADVNDLFVFYDIVQICLWIMDSVCSKDMTGNRALLTNFVESFLERFALATMILRVGQFCDKSLEVALRKSTCFVRTEDGVDLLTSDCSSNLYTIALNKVASNSSEISPKDTETSKSPTPVSPSSSIGSSSPVRSTTPPPDYPFDKSIFAELDNSLWIIPRPLGGEPDPEEPNELDAYDHLWK